MKRFVPENVPRVPVRGIMGLLALGGAAWGISHSIYNGSAEADEIIACRFRFVLTVSQWMVVTVRLCSTASPV